LSALAGKSPTVHATYTYISGFVFSARRRNWDIREKRALKVNPGDKRGVPRALALFKALEIFERIFPEQKGGGNSPI